MTDTGRIVLGGTFDHLHVGHEALLMTAFQVGRRVAIGLTSPDYLADHPKPEGRRIQSYGVRHRALARWLAARYPRSRWAIVPISDRFGGSVESGVGGLVVSADTIDGGRAVNAERRRLGRPSLTIEVVPMVLADDLEPVSSRRVRAGQIDRVGHRIAPIQVGLAAGAADRVAAERAVRTVFPRARLTVLPESPARQRFPPRAHAVRAARAAVRRAEIGIGIVRTSPRRWLVAIRTPRVALPPRPISGELDIGLARMLSPSAHRKPF